MQSLDVKKTQFKVSDFLSWQRDGSLILSPSFQRRSVWKPEAKSYFVDTVLRGLPAPVIYIRDRVDLETQRTTREIVDGQQRLRTLLAYIDPSSLKDYDEARDGFSIKTSHNKTYAGKMFRDLGRQEKTQVLGYEFSTHVLPTSIEDRDVLKIFARLNATGVRLNRQELRNAEYFGVFKSLIYDLALEQLERWRNWRILSEDQIARMEEVELTSDLVMNMLFGLTGKSQAKLDRLYRDREDAFPEGDELSRRFRRVMDMIDDVFGRDIRETTFSSTVNFFTLFVFFYDQTYGLGSTVERAEPARLVGTTRDCLLEANRQIRDKLVPPAVLDAIGRASADYGRRKTRLDFLHSVCRA